MKKIITFIMALAMLLSIAPSAMAKSITLVPTIEGKKNKVPKWSDDIEKQYKTDFKDSNIVAAYLYKLCDYKDGQLAILFDKKNSESCLNRKWVNFNII